MDAFDTLFDSFGVAAVFVIMLLKAIGIPIPIPGDVVVLAMGARAAAGKVLLLAAGLGVWVVMVRRCRGGSVLEAVAAWEDATCPVCLTIGGAALRS